MVMKRAYYRIGFTAGHSAELWERWKRKRSAVGAPLAPERCQFVRGLVRCGVARTRARKWMWPGHLPCGRGAHGRSAYRWRPVAQAPAHREPIHSGRDQLTRIWPIAAAYVNVWFLRG